MKPKSKQRREGFIMRENLMRALRVAIESNQRNGCGFNGETLGWQQVLNDLNNGRSVEIIEQTNPHP